MRNPLEWDRQAEQIKQEAFHRTDEALRQAEDRATAWLLIGLVGFVFGPAIGAIISALGASPSVSITAIILWCAIWAVGVLLGFRHIRLQHRLTCAATLAWQRAENEKLLAEIRNPTGGSQ